MVWLLELFKLPDFYSQSLPITATCCKFILFELSTLVFMLLVIKIQNFKVLQEADENKLYFNLF